MTHADAARYSLIIEWSDEDHVYIATAPELPGCRTHGATRTEAIEKGEDAIALWLDAQAYKGRSAPVPRVFDGWSNLGAGAARRVGAPV